jgi:phosphate/sulfate permease
MDHREGFIASCNLAAGWPWRVHGTSYVNDTRCFRSDHRVGVRKGGAIDWQRVKEIALAWIITVPAAALLGILTYALLHAIRLR